MTQSANRITDEYLVLAARSGSSRAFEHLIRRYQRPLWRFAYRLVGSEDNAWDVLQESWMVVTKGLNKLEEAAQFRRWVFGIVRIRASALQRSNARLPVDNRIEAIGARPEHVAESNDDLAAMKLVLAQLNSHHRNVLVLHYLEDFEVWEIAEILGVPEGTVKSRLYHARLSMKQVLERSKS